MRLSESRGKSRPQSGIKGEIRKEKGERRDERGRWEEGVETLRAASAWFAVVLCSSQRQLELSL